MTCRKSTCVCTSRKSGARLGLGDQLICHRVPALSRLVRCSSLFGRTETRWTTAAIAISLPSEVSWLQIECQAVRAAQSRLSALLQQVLLRSKPVRQKRLLQISASLRCAVLRLRCRLDSCFSLMSCFHASSLASIRRGAGTGRSSTKPEGEEAYTWRPSSAPSAGNP